VQEDETFPTQIEAKKGDQKSSITKSRTIKDRGEKAQGLKIARYCRS